MEGPWVIQVESEDNPAVLKGSLGLLNICFMGNEITGVIL